MNQNLIPSFDFLPKYQSKIKNWHPHMPFGHDLIRSLKPKTIVELGVHYGDSYFCFCQSVKKLKLGSLCYAVDTWNGDKQSGFYGKEVHEEVLSHNTRYYSDFSYLLRMSFDEASSQFQTGQIDLLHLDGLHTYDAILNDFNLWIDRVSTGGIILIHDIACREKGFGVWKFWDEIKTLYPSFTFNQGHGLGVIQKTKPGSYIQLNDFNFHLVSETEMKKSYAHAYKLMRGILVKEKIDDRNYNLQTKCEYLEEQFVDYHKERVHLEEQNKVLLAKVKNLELTLSDKPNFSGLANEKMSSGKLVTWIDPKLNFKVVSGKVFVCFILAIGDQVKYKSFLIKLGKRTIPCEREFLFKDNNKNLLFLKVSCNFKTGSGFKLCKVFGELESGLCQSLGWRLYYSIPTLDKKSSNNRTVLSTNVLKEGYTMSLKFNQFQAKHRLVWDSLQCLKRSCEVIDYSFIMPVYDPPLKLLRETVNSIRDQSFPNWELCIVNDGSTNLEIHEYLTQLSLSDSRIVYSLSQRNEGIAIATNHSIKLSQGEFLIFVDHDDTIEPSALSEINSYLSSNQGVDFLYTDDDKIDLLGNRYSPQFKPDWSPELLLSYCYISHIKVVRRSVSEKVGHIRTGYDGSQDYDYILRVCEVARNVGHIPKVLYHWRSTPTSTAANGLNKPNSLVAGKRAVQDCVDRRGINARVFQPSWAVKEGLGVFKLIFPNSGPNVEILIPTRNNLKFLRRCLTSIELTTYKNYTVTIIDNESDDPATINFMHKTNHRVLRVPNKDKEFNFSYLVNRGVEAASSDYILLLNDDTEVIEPSWLSQMVGYLTIQGVGVVGAKLLFPNGKIQHAGILNGIFDGLPAPVFRGFSGNEAGYLNYLRVARNYKAVTAACLLTTKQIFQKVGGFNESDLAVAYNDVDFCYRIEEKLKKRCVYCPDARLFHVEGSSRGGKDNFLEEFYFREKYANQKDPFYSPNFSPTDGNFKIIPYCLPLPFQSSIKVVAFTHNLNLEGAPLSMLEMISGLLKRGKIKPTIISLCDGPLRKEYEACGIAVRVVPFNDLDCTVNNYMSQLRRWIMSIKLHDYDLVYANTLNLFFAIHAANEEKIPSIWNIRESTIEKEAFGRISQAVAERAFKTFQYPYRIIFVAKSTRELFQNYDCSNNFAVIRNVLATNEKPNSVIAKDKLPEHKNLLLCVGTICKRKSQREIVDAFETLPLDILDETGLVFLGDKSSSYAKSLESKVNTKSKIRDNVYFLGSVKNVDQWYSTACAFVFASRNESYPRVILEAMGAGLPIITTSVFGIKEQVVDDLNAIVYEPGEISALADAMARIITDKKLRERLSIGSKNILRSLGSYDKLLEKYEDIFLEAASSSCVSKLECVE